MTHPAADAVSSAVEKLYNTYPFPPEPLLDEPPPGYNWRWFYPSAYAFCTGRAPARRAVRILDAGCGTGVSTDYLTHLNPEAEVIGVDLSPGALEVARERCRRSGAERAQFINLSIYDLAQLPGQFDHINCVGVLHHMADPVRGIRALADKLAPGGILHIFVYGELGRWEISLMQKAIALLQGEKRGDYTDGVRLGREIFAQLPESNRILQSEKRRWSLENHRDEAFADMYVHPQEIDYNVETLFELIDASGLEFAGFSNPQFWDPERLIGNSSLLRDRFAALNERQRYRLIELIDPETTHYEFFLVKPPCDRQAWADEAQLLAAIPERNPCMHGWPSRQLFDFDYRVVDLSEAEFAFLEACDGNGDRLPVRTLLEGCSLTPAQVRQLQARQLILLSPA